MRMTEEEARERFATERVARLATADAEARPHVVPIVFVLAGGPAPAGGERLYTAVDRKPKSTTALRRLADIDANPAVAALADGYSEDWSALWWSRLEGRARVLPPGREASHAVDLLRDRYPQYRAAPPEGPVVAVEIVRWTGWSATPARAE
jgi:PPOX class probable F420-dependent enzyme